MQECGKLKSSFSLPTVAPNVTIYPSSPLAKRKHSLLLSCFSSSSQVPVFTWRKDSVDLSSNPLVSISSHTTVSDLYIEKFEDTLLGEFSCTADDEFHGPEQASVEVKLSTDIYLLWPLANQSEFEGAVLEVLCPVDGGAENLKMEWRKGDLLLESSPGVTIATALDSSSIPSILFDKITVSHEGNYSCLVEDSQQSKTFPFLVTVYSKSYWWWIVL